MNFRNDSPLGDLIVEGVGFVAAGDVFEATGDAAQPFLAQPGNYAHVIRDGDGWRDAPPHSDAAQAGESGTPDPNVYLPPEPAANGAGDDAPEEPQP